MRKKLRYAYVRLLRSPGAPKEIASGMALGLFVSVLPVMGLQMPLAVLLAELVRRLLKVRMSRVAAAAGVWLTNPLTAAPIYGLTYLLGRPFVRLVGGTAGPSELPAAQGQHLADSTLELPAAAAEGALGGPLAVEVALALVVGGVLAGIPLALLGYQFTYRLVKRYHDRREARQLRGRAASLQQPAALPRPSSDAR